MRADRPVPVTVRADRPDPVLEWSSHLFLVGLVAASAVGMVRLFADTAFLRDVLALAFASCLVSAASRRAGVSAPVALVMSAACLIVTATVLRYQDTAWYALPTGDTLEAVRLHLSEAWGSLAADKVPLEARPGLVLAVGALLWASAFASDTAAFRMRSPAAAVAPSAALFVFTAAVGTGDDQLLHAMAFCAAAGAVLVVLTLRNAGRDAVWIEAPSGRGLLAMARTGFAIAGMAVTAGAAFGPLLPGADEPPWIDFDSIGRQSDSRTVVSPLVQVRSRLVSRGSQEMFTVAVPEGARQYWRLMSLNIFDGSSWRARSWFADAAGPLPATVPAVVEGERLIQSVTIGALANIYLPAAYEVRRVLDDGGVPLEYEPASGALVTADGALPDDAVSREGFTYVVESAGPDIGDHALLEYPARAASSADLPAGSTDLPADFPAAVSREAARVTRSARSDFERARLLQDYFWDDGRFSYDVGVALGHGVADLEDFLFEVRSGYCEQFAAAYAAMARSIGLPARVAVGFTWGEWDSEREVYAVLGRHAHAWPEVFFAGVGWVRFEPTPGRGAPDYFAVTGRAAAQADAVSERPESAAAASGARAGTPQGRTAGLSGAAGDGSPDADDGEGAWRGRALSAAGAAALGAAALAGAAVPALRQLRRRRLRARNADDPSARVVMAFNDALEALRLVGVEPGPSETPLELARRMRSGPWAWELRRAAHGLAMAAADRRRPAPAPGPRLAAAEAGPPSDALTVLADSAVRGLYAPAGSVSEERAEQAERAARRIAAVCRRGAPRSRKLAAFFDPRPLFG